MWSYLDPLVDRIESGEVSWLQAALVYPARPPQAGRTEFIEEVLGEHGISVVWWEDLDNMVDRRL